MWGYSQPSLPVDVLQGEWPERQQKARGAGQSRKTRISATKRPVGPSSRWSRNKDLGSPDCRGAILTGTGLPPWPPSLPRLSPSFPLRSPGDGDVIGRLARLVKEYGVTVTFRAPVPSTMQRGCPPPSPRPRDCWAQACGMPEVSGCHAACSTRRRVMEAKDNHQEMTGVVQATRGSSLADGSVVPDA